MGTEAKIVIKGDSSSAVSAVGRLKTELGGLQAIASKALLFGGIAAGATALVSGLISATKSAIDAGDALAKLSQKTGVSVEDLGKLQYAAELSGVSTESLAKGLTSLAVGMIESTSGAVTPAAEAFTKFGITMRNADGSVKSSRAVFGELADRFAAMPDGPEKAAAAVDIFGKRIGADMIPLLNGGSKALAQMGDEAERLGIVMSTEAAKKFEEFNDNLTRLSKLSSAAGINIAQSLIPALNRLITEFLDAGKAGLSFTEALFGIGLSDPTKGAAEQIARINEQIEKLRKGSSGLSQKLRDEIGGIGNNDAAIADLEKLRKYYELQQERQTGDGVASAQELADKRVAIERQMQTKLADLAKLRGIADGKVSADILDNDEKRTATQIKNAEKLRSALVKTWEDSLKTAQEAGAAAQKLFSDAANIRQTGADKAANKRLSALSPEDQQSTLQNRFNEAASAAEQAAGLALIAKFSGRTENAAKLAAQATKDAERAAALADRIDDPNAGAAAIERAAKLQADLLEQQAKAKLEEQAAAKQAAEIQGKQVAELDKQITDLQTKAAAIKVQADISAAQGALVQLQAQLDALQDKTITVTVNQVGSQDAPLPGLSSGGYTGPGSKFQPAGIVHAGEYVLRQEVVRQRGALAFLARFNRVGLAALSGYADGGLVRNLHIPTIATPTPAAAGSRVTFNFPGMGAHDATMAPDALASLKTAFAREALKKGGRR